MVESAESRNVIVKRKREKIQTSYLRENLIDKDIQKMYNVISLD